MEALPPQKIQLEATRQHLALHWPAGVFRLSAEYLRVHSPSAELHRHGQRRLLGGKQHVKIHSLRPVGHYALQIVFSDGHSSGLYSWAHLWDLAQHEALYWQNYLDALAAAGKSRCKK